MEISRKDHKNPLTSRYASKEIRYIFSDEFKFTTWRKCWLALAESEKELGLNITDEQIAELRKNIYNINYDIMEKKEKELRHDLMAGVHTYGIQCPKAMPIIHLGATSCDITDNTELIQNYNALKHIKIQLVSLIRELSNKAIEYKDLECLGYTHFQPAQPVTMGKRIALWLHDIVIIYNDIDNFLNNFKLRGIKGATGTQDSFLKLFNDNKKIEELNKLYCEKLGFNKSFYICGQTYSRLYDTKIMDILKNLSQCCHKFATDFRLMQHLKMVDEPFEKDQIGSSAMAYKKNPMRCERICSLSRYVMAQSSAADNTHALQWFERTLDDSAGRRLYLSSSFMGVDSILNIYFNVISKFVVYPEIIKKLLFAELPFMATETIIMRSVKNGGDRQELHEIIRKNAVKVSDDIKNGKENDLLQKLAEEKLIPFNIDELEDIVFNTKFSGLSSIQVKNYIKNEVEPILEENKNIIFNESELSV